MMLQSGRPRNRTGTGFTPVDFESTASASSARRPRTALLSTPARRGKIRAGARVDLCRQSDAFAQRRMRVNRAPDVLRIGSHFDGQADLRDQLAGIQPHDASADGPSGRLVEQQLGEAVLASVGDRPPAQAISGSVYATEGIWRASNDALCPAATSAATCPSCVALWASIGGPAMSPTAKMCGTLVRICLSVRM